MSNTDKGRGRKGSKFWMQVVVEDNTMQNELNRMIGEDLEWISPLAGPEEIFDEYELRDPYVCHKLGKFGTHPLRA